MKRARVRPPLALVVAPLLLGAAVPARAQAPLPWAGPAQPAKAVAETVTESQLPLVRVRLEAASGVSVGQAVPLVVEVIVPSWFTAAPKFPDLEVPNAVTLSPEASWNFAVQSGGRTFSGQARRYLVFPQVSGRYTIPSPKVEASYALPDGKPSPIALLAGSSLAFEARVPPGAKGAKYFLTADGFRLRQSFSRKPGDLQAGDSLDRTVTMTAQNTAGISLPPLTFEVPDGIRLYPGTPAVTETAERGRVEATRTEKVTYLAEKEGRYTLPEIVILWWNPTSRTTHRASLPPVELNVRASAGFRPEVFAGSEAEDGRPPGTTTGSRRSLRTALQLLAVLVAALLVVLAAWKLLGLGALSPAAWLAARRARRREAEATWFKRFRRASRSRDPRSALRHLMFWLDCADGRPTVPTLERFAGESGVAGLSREARHLGELLFTRRANSGGDSRASWSGTRLYKAVARARRSGREATRRARQPVMPTLRAADDSRQRNQ